MLLSYLSMLETPKEKQKFEEIYEANRHRMFNAAKGILHDDYLAEDAVHEAFVRLIRYFSKAGRLSCQDLQNYIVIIVKNVARDMLKKQSKIIEVAFDEAYAGQCDDEAVSQFEYGELFAVVGQLPDIYREVCYLTHILGFSANEIAGSLDLSVDAVWQRQTRAKQKLRALLVEAGKMEGIQK